MPLTGLLVAINPRSFVDMFVVVLVILFTLAFVVLIISAIHYYARFGQYDPEPNIRVRPTLVWTFEERGLDFPREEDYEAAAVVYGSMNL